MAELTVKFQKHCSPLVPFKLFTVATEIYHFFQHTLRKEIDFKLPLGAITGGGGGYMNEQSTDSKLVFNAIGISDGMSVFAAFGWTFAAIGCVRVRQGLELAPFTTVKHIRLWISSMSVNRGVQPLRHRHLTELRSSVGERMVSTRECCRRTCSGWCTAVYIGS